MAVLVAGSRSPRGNRSTVMAYVAPADGDVLLAVAEHARWVSEYVNGNTASNTYGNLPQVAPPTPVHGEQHPGHDHTGGIMGHPQKHTIWQTSWGYSDQANLDHGVAPLTSNLTTPSRIIDSDLPGIWCPPGYVYGVGVELTIVLRVGTSTADVNIRAQMNGAVSEDTSVSVPTGTQIVTFPSLLPMRPGWNTLHLKVEVTSWSTTGDAFLTHAALHQIHDVPVPTITP